MSVKKGELVVVTNELTTQIKFDKQDLIDVGVQSVVEAAAAKLAVAQAEHRALLEKEVAMRKEFCRQAHDLAEAHELTAMFRRTCGKGVPAQHSYDFGTGTIEVALHSRNCTLEFSFKHKSVKQFKQKQDQMMLDLEALSTKISQLRYVVDHPAQFERKFKAALSAQRLKGSQEGEAMLEAITKSAELVAKDF